MSNCDIDEKTPIVNYFSFWKNEFFDKIIIL